MAIENPNVDKSSPEERRRTLKIVIFIGLIWLTIAAARSCNHRIRNHHTAHPGERKTAHNISITIDAEQKSVFATGGFFAVLVKSI